MDQENTMNTKEILTALLQKYDTSHFRSELDDAAQQIFEAIPELEIVLICAQTPTFNDGDPCLHYQEDPVFIVKVDHKYEAIDHNYRLEEEDIIAFLQRFQVNLDDDISPFLSKSYNYFHKENELHANLRLATKVFFNLESKFFHCFGTNWVLAFFRTPEGIILEGPSGLEPSY